MGLVIETKIDRVGRGKGAWLWFHDGIQTDADRGEVFRHKGIADGKVIHATVGIEDIEGDTIAVGRTEGETIVDQCGVVGPFRRVGIHVGMAEIVEKGQKTGLCNFSFDRRFSC